MKCLKKRYFKIKIVHINHKGRYKHKDNKIILIKERIKLIRKLFKIKNKNKNRNRKMKMGVEVVMSLNN